MRHCLPLLLVLLVACEPVPEPEPPPDFTVRPGVEIVTVLDGPADAPLTLRDRDGTELVTMIADEDGQAHFAYVPDTPMTLDFTEGFDVPILEGGVLKPGDDYAIYDESQTPPLWSGRFRVLAVDEAPASSLYEGQYLRGIHESPLSGADGDVQTAFQYIEVRDGTLLSAQVRFPDPLIYGDGPYPTVIEYSGYSPSRPDSLGPGLQIANALGYATVGVNMRGTGCSGGVFDVFNRAQHADGYDVVEVVARQDWVLHGHVGMVGLSYPGISQLYVASTAPPSLAAVVPLSVIGDAWAMQWPGGVYNAGFTAQWLGQRNADAAQGGSSWVNGQIEGGDATCAENLRLSNQNVEFEPFLHGLEFRPRDAADRDLNELVEQIEVPAFVGGAWQDEQTGALFGGMLDRFVRSPGSRFVVYNGRHPDGYAPDTVFRWFEFLELHVAQRIPHLNGLIRGFGADTFAGQFGIADYSFPDDRFEDYRDADDYPGALAAYEAEPPVTVLYESGAGGSEPGDPAPTFIQQAQTWPIAGLPTRTFFADAEGRLVDDAPTDPGADRYAFDPDAGSSTFFGPDGYQLLRPLWDIDWTYFPEGAAASYVSQPFADDVVLSGPGVAALWLRSPVDDVTVQVTLTEVRPDGVEVLVQSGMLRLGHRAATREGLRLVRDYSMESFDPVPVDEWVSADVEIPSFAHPFRAGSRLRMAVTTPGRNFGTWEFEAPAYDSPPSFELGRGAGRSTALVLAEIPGLTVPPGLPPCPSLRGQPCRDYVPSPNTPAD